jgi:hypothetical protein
MSFFGREALAERARANPAKPQATMGEAARASFDYMLNQQSSLSASTALYNEYESYRRELHALTGKRLFNPLFSGGFHRHKREALFFRHVDKLREQLKDVPDSGPDIIPRRSPEGIRAKIAAEREQERLKVADISQRSHGFLPWIAGMGGTTAAALADPPIFLSMAFGAPWATGILRGALIDAGIGIVAEAGVQTSVQLGRRQFGEEPDVGEALTTVGAVGAGGFLLSGALRGGVKGTKALVQKARGLPERFRTPEVRAAENYLAQQNEVRDSNPFPDTAEGLALHDELLRQAHERLTHTDTGVAQVLRASEPIRMRVQEEAPIVSGEPTTAFFARVRAENPELFVHFDAADEALNEATARLTEITTRLETPPTAVRPAEELASLRQQVAATKDRRKIKRLNTKIAALEKQHGAGVAKRAAAERSRTTKLTNERKKLTAEVGRLAQRRAQAAARVDRAVQKTTPLRSATQVIRVKQIIGDEMDATSIAARGMAEVGATAALAVERTVAKERGAGRATTAPTTPAVDATRIAVKRAEVTARDATVETEVRAALEADPEARMEVLDTDGNARQITARELLDDLADDEILLRELGDCIKGALV